MRKHIGWLWIIAFSAWFAAANAQTASPPAVTQFDGTYAFVCATKVNETYTTRTTEHIIRCGDYLAGGPLTIVNSQARYKGRYYEGTVGSQGELVMVLVREPTDFGETLGGTVSGMIDKDGNVRARRNIGDCSYDTTWRKESK